MTASAFSFDEPADAGRLYCLCFFDRGWIVPQVQFLEAENDQDALVAAGTMRPWMIREVWEGHRLVRVLPAAPSARGGERCELEAY